MACRKEVFEAVGGFRPNRRSQDRELTLRLLLAGYRGRYVPNMINSRMRLESTLIASTAAFLALYIPLETYLSLPNLLSPLYIVDVIGMALLLGGLLGRGRRSGAPLLVAGFAWTGANFWRGMADRLRMAAASQNGWTEARVPWMIAIGGALVLLAIIGLVCGGGRVCWSTRHFQTRSRSDLRLGMSDVTTSAMPLDCVRPLNTDVHVPLSWNTWTCVAAGAV